MRAVTLPRRFAIFFASGLAFGMASATPLASETIIEAEASINIGNGWISVGANGAEPAHIITTSLPTDNGSSGMPAAYQLNIDHDATYQFWLRVYAPSDANNSLEWSIDGTTFTANWAPSQSAWQWIAISAKGIKLKKVL